jgi:3-hydroxybutyryl-CoA dehydrogenase
MNVHSIIICGAGTMGSGIAQVSAMHGHPTTLYDPFPGAIEKARTKMEAGLQGLVEKGKMSPVDAEQALQRLTFSDQLEDLRPADLVIEAIIEDLSAKIALFSSLGSIRKPSTIWASNTSSLSINALGEVLPDPGRIAGMHFFNPAPLMRLVEVVAGKATDPAVLETLRELTLGWNKVPVLCLDAPGFIVNRVARAYYLEALQMLEEGACSMESIDRIAEASGFKMGPFRLMDLIGNDINLAVSQSLYEASGYAPRFRPSPIQQAKVQAGELGRKTSKGYYSYS